MQELILQITTFLRGMWKYRRLGVAVAWLVAAGAATTVLLMPDRYEASARVYVDTQSILRPLMSGLAVQPNIEQQVNMLSRTLISRPTVEKLIRMADLDLGAQSKAEQDKLITQVTDSLSIRSTGRDNLYTLAYQGESPEKAPGQHQIRFGHGASLHRRANQELRSPPDGSGNAAQGVSAAQHRYSVSGRA